MGGCAWGRGEEIKADMQLGGWTCYQLRSGKTVGREDFCLFFWWKLDRMIIYLV